MGSQRVGHDWATELNWTQICRKKINHNHQWHIDPQDSPGSLQLRSHQETEITKKLSLLPFWPLKTTREPERCIWDKSRRRKWLPTPVFLPGESHRWGSLVGCHLGGGTESVRHHSSDLAAAGLLSSGLAPLQLPKLSLLQTPAFWFVWAQLCIGPTNLGSTRPLLFLSPSLYSSPRMKVSKLRDEVLEQRIATLFRKP